MTTLDGDWICEQDSDECFAVWQSCDRCGKVACPDSITGGLLPKGQGIPIAEEPGNLWYEGRDELSDWDICPDCMGSGGGYICGFHDEGD